MHLYKLLALPVLSAALLTIPVVGAAQEAENNLPCPGATAWEEAHPEQSHEARAQRDAARTLTAPALRAELHTRFKHDQEARNTWLSAPDSRSLQAVKTIDADDLAWLHALVREHGFPTAAQVGEGGVEDAWLLAQHADRDPRFQAALLPSLQQRYLDGELSATSLSRFADRVLVAFHQPQRYGTQFSTAEWESSHFGLSDEKSVHAIDDNRRELGVMPLADYVCKMSRERKARL